MNISAIDLGITSGYAYYKDSKFDYSENLISHNMIHWQKRLTELLKRNKSELLLIELPTFNHESFMKTKLLSLDASVRVVSFECKVSTKFIRPTDWKSTPARTCKLPVIPYKPTIHEKDAIRMIIWWLRFGSKQQHGD